MVFLLVSLSVYMVMRFVEEYVTAPRLVIMLLPVALAAGGLALAGENPAWCAAAGAVAWFCGLLEGLILALRDWARVSLLSRGMRR